MHATCDDVQQFINAYNEQVHTSTGVAPNRFSERDERNYIAKMDMKDYDVRAQDHFKLKVGDKVRIVYGNKPLQKKRTNLPKEHYVIDSVDGNGYIIKAMDESVAYYPRHKQVKDSSDSFAAILDNGKRAIINDIIGYNERSQKYKVIYTDNSVDYIKAKSLRETNPTSL